MVSSLGITLEPAFIDPGGSAGVKAWPDASGREPQSEDSLQLGLARGLCGLNTVGTGIQAVNLDAIILPGPHGEIALRFANSPSWCR